MENYQSKHTGQQIDEAVEKALKFSGSALPEITESDNGKFLRVVDGTWAVVVLTDVSQEGA